MTEGHCLCGALRYQVDGPFIDLLHCHCSMCRKHHGTPFATWAAAPSAGFRWTSDTSTLASYRSSEKGHIYVDSKAPWYEITDDLPQFAEMPPRR